jgi:hypothetical protein
MGAAGTYRMEHICAEVDKIGSMYGLDDKVILEGYHLWPDVGGSSICIDALARKDYGYKKLVITKKLGWNVVMEGAGEVRLMAAAGALARQVTGILKAKGVSVSDCIMWDDKYLRTPAPESDDSL